MTRRVVALTGIPGVGKSTVLSTLGERLSFVTLKASALLRKARDDALMQTVTHDGLRYVDLAENQRLLIQSFEVSATDEMALVVLDGHSIIERDNDYVRVDPAVFGAIGIQAMIFLHDDPAAIFARREHDAGRHRPKKNADALGCIQHAARSHAEEICRALRVPLYSATPRDLDLMSNLLLRTRDGEAE